VIAVRAFGFAAGMVELMARGMHPQRAFPVLTSARDLTSMFFARLR